MTTRDLIDDLRSRINPAYAAQIGTESYERRLCAEALEAQANEIERLRLRLDHVDAQSEQLGEALTVVAAAKNLVAQKGRHNTEIAYGRLVRALK